MCTFIKIILGIVYLQYPATTYCVLSINSPQLTERRYSKFFDYLQEFKRYTKLCGDSDLRIYAGALRGLFNFQAGPLYRGFITEIDDVRSKQAYIFARYQTGQTNRTDGFFSW